MRENVVGTIYLIHFDKPYKHARHYLGWTESHAVETRIAKHRSGNGARLIRVIQEAGIAWKVVRTWPGVTRSTERKLKKNGGSRRLCPVCRAERKCK